MRFPYTYIGMTSNKHAAWHAPRMSSESLTPSVTTMRLAIKLAPYEIIPLAKSLSAMTCVALAPCVSIRYARDVPPEMTRLKCVNLRR